MVNKISIPLTPEAFAQVSTIILPAKVASSRKVRSLQNGLGRNSQYIEVADMFKQGREVQLSFGENPESIIAGTNGADKSWMSLLTFAATCACHLTSCGQGDEHGCVLGRDTRALKMAGESVTLDAETNSLIINLDKLKSAYDKWFENAPMGMTGRMCGDKADCQGPCTFNDINTASESVLISYFEAFMEEIGLLKLPGFDKAWIENFYEAPAIKTGKKVAVIGAGPAGLMEALMLARMGHDVTIFEASGKVGGTVRHGVPHDKYTKAYLDKIQALLEKMGVKFVFNTRIGKDISFEEIETQFDTYSWNGGVVRSPKSAGKGVDEYATVAMDYLTPKNAWITAMKESGLGQDEYEKLHPLKESLRDTVTIVIGKGYTAYDIVREALRDMASGGDPAKINGKVIMVYYKGDFEETPDFPLNTSKFADTPTAQMMQHARNNGGVAEQMFYLNIKAVEKSEAGTKLTFDLMACTNEHIARQNPASAKYESVGNQVMEFGPEVDVRIMNAIGYNRKAAIKDTNLGEINNHQHFQREGWFGAGDIASNDHEVVHAFRSGILAAASIDDWLKVKESGVTWEEHSAKSIQHELNRDAEMSTSARLGNLFGNKGGCAVGCGGR